MLSDSAWSMCAICAICLCGEKCFADVLSQIVASFVWFAVSSPRTPQCGKNRVVDVSSHVWHLSCRPKCRPPSLPAPQVLVGRDAAADWEAVRAALLARHPDKAATATGLVLNRMLRSTMDEWQKARPSVNEVMGGSAGAGAAAPDPSGTFGRNALHICAAAAGHVSDAQQGGARPVVKRVVRTK